MATALGTVCQSEGGKEYRQVKHTVQMNLCEEEYALVSKSMYKVGWEGMKTNPNPEKNVRGKAERKGRKEKG